MFILSFISFSHNSNQINMAANWLACTLIVAPISYAIGGFVQMKTEERNKVTYARQKLDTIIKRAEDSPSSTSLQEMHDAFGEFHLDNDYRTKRWNDFWNAFGSIVQQRRSLQN